MATISSLTTPGKYLSLSFWRDEDALVEWRNRAHHRNAQAKGRFQQEAHATSLLSSPHTVTVFEGVSGQ